jgi:hypothetical protein
MQQTFMQRIISSFVAPVLAALAGVEMVLSAGDQHIFSFAFFDSFADYFFRL